MSLNSCYKKLKQWWSGEITRFLFLVSTRRFKAFFFLDVITLWGNKTVCIAIVGQKNACSAIVCLWRLLLRVVLSFSRFPLGGKGGYNLYYPNLIYTVDTTGIPSWTPNDNHRYPFWGNPRRFCYRWNLQTPEASIVQDLQRILWLNSNPVLSWLAVNRSKVGAGTFMIL